MLTKSEKRRQTRVLIRKYLERAEANKADIHYSQDRLLTSLGDSPDSEFETDCSGLVISAFFWADKWTTFAVKDPGGYNYSGAGNTGSILRTNYKRAVPFDHTFYLGDMALFGTWSHTEHVIICRANGTFRTSKWTSHGVAARS